MWDTIKIILKIIIEIILSFFLGLAICILAMAAYAIVLMWPIFIPIIMFLCIFGVLLYFVFN